MPGNVSRLLEGAGEGRLSLLDRARMRLFVQTSVSRVPPLPGVNRLRLSANSGSDTVRFNGQTLWTRDLARHCSGQSNGGCRIDMAGPQ